MKLRITPVIYSILFMCLANPVHAGDAAAGKAKSATCSGCHGADGIGTNDQNPNLAGQKEAYLVKATKAYRDGTRSDPMMGAMLKALSDTDIENISAFYSSLK
ncbi:MAG: cytochrome c [Gammaproteobacteria bacterium]|nr:cytochrome c [Gammaproteobacteria bacterium]